MPVTRHTPQVPGISLTSVPFDLSGCPSSEIRAALDVILAATTNLRDYRDRLSAEDHTATVLDIEEAVERIARGLERERGSLRTAVAGKRRIR